MSRVGGVGLGKMHISPYGISPAKVWLLDPHVVGWTDVGTILCIFWWGNERKDREFKKGVYAGTLDICTPLERFEDYARLGAWCL